MYLYCGEFFHSCSCGKSNKTRALGKLIPLPSHVIVSKLENLDYFFSYPDGDPDHSENLTGSKLA